MDVWYLFPFGANILVKNEKLDVMDIDPLLIFCSLYYNAHGYQKRISVNCTCQSMSESNAGVWSSGHL